MKGEGGMGRVRGEGEGEIRTLAHRGTLPLRFALEFVWLESSVEILTLAPRGTRPLRFALEFFGLESSVQGTSKPIPPEGEPSGPLLDQPPWGDSNTGA